MPSTTRELNKEMIDKLYMLLEIKKALPEGLVIAELEKAIKRAKAPMTKEEIAWVEALIDE